MAKCSVAVTVDGWSSDGDVAPTFQVGQPIAGTVHVWVAEPVRCDGLDVRLALEATTRGYSLPESSPPLRLFSGEWQPGEYDYRFELPSHLPPSHDGHHIGWAWVARATVDVPWAIDPKGEARFVLAAPPTSGKLDVWTPAPDQVQAGETSALFKALVLSGILFGLSLLVLAAGVLLMLLELAPDDVSGPIAGLGTMGSFATGLIFFGLLWLRHKGGGTRYVSAVKLTRQHGVYCEVQTRGGGAIDRVVAQLVVREYAHWTTKNPSGESRTTHEYEEVFAREEVPLVADSAGRLWSGELPLPTLDREVPPYTLCDSQGRGLVWQVNVLSYPKGSSKPDVETRYLTVRPADWR